MTTAREASAWLPERQRQWQRRRRQLTGHSGGQPLLKLCRRHFCCYVFVFVSLSVSLSQFATRHSSPATSRLATQLAKTHTQTHRPMIGVAHSLAHLQMTSRLMVVVVGRSVGRRRRRRHHHCGGRCLTHRCLADAQSAPDGRTPSNNKRANEQTNEMQILRPWINWPGGL